MDRNDLQDNGLWDLDQFFCGNTSQLGLSKYVKIKILCCILFFLEFFKKSSASENSKNFTERGPYHVNT